MSWRKNTLAFALCLSSLMSTANSNAASELDKTIKLMVLMLLVTNPAFCLATASLKQKTCSHCV